MARAQAACRANKHINIEAFKDATSRRDYFFNAEMYPDDMVDDTQVISLSYVSIHHLNSIR